MYSPTLLTLFLATLTAASPTPEAAQQQVKRDSWGGSLSLGPTTSYILSATTTIIPGDAPSTQAGKLFLWPGMSNGTGDLIQTTLESWPDNAWCGAKTGQWCIRASLFGSFGQLDGQAGVVSGSDQVFINYTRNADAINWTQLVSNAVTGAPLSNFTHESGPMTGWGTGTECNGGCTGTIAEQRYQNTVIKLAGADTAFGKTLKVQGGTTYSGLSVSADGTVWTIDEIVVPAMK